MSEELKPCPFCDNPAVEVQYNGPNEDQIKEALSVGHDWDVSYFVACWCGCTGPERAEEDAAIRGWNQRSDSSQARLSEAVKVLDPFLNVRDQHPESVKLINGNMDIFTVIAVHVTKGQFLAAKAFLATLGEEK